MSVSVKAIHGLPTVHFDVRLNAIVGGMVDINEALALKAALEDALVMVRQTCPHAKTLHEVRETTYKLSCARCGAVRGGGLL